MMQPTYYNGEDYNTRRYAGYYGRGLGAQSGHYGGGGGGNGFTICAVTITGALQIVFGIAAIILGSLIAEEYGLERSGNYTNIGIAIWCGIIYLIAGLIGAFVCCCVGWGSYSTNGAQSCLLLSYMIVSLLAILCALGHLVADAVFLSRINLDDSFYCIFTNGNCEYLRGLLIGSVVIAVLELLTAITASILGCTISCCGGGCFGGGLYYGGNAGNMGNVFYGGRDQMLSARGPIGLQGPMLGQGTTTQGPMLMRQAPFMNTVSGGDYYNGGGQYY